MTPTPTPADDWHVPAGQLAAYVDASLPQVQAWSVEAHLIDCAGCRAALSTRLMDGGSSTAGLLREVGARLDVLPEQVAVSRARFARRIWLIAGPRRPLFGSWLLSICLVLAGAVLLDHFAGRGFGGLGGLGGTSWAGTLSGTGRGRVGSAVWFGDGGSWVVLVAPLMPLLGVALAYGPGLDPGYELVAATPGGGLRLVLWRTAGVLAIALPVTALAGFFGVDGGWTEVAKWLLPGLAMTLATLALGTAVGLARAGAVIGMLWVSGTLAPVLIGLAPPLLTSVPPAAWLTLAAASTGLALARHDRFAQLGLGRTTTEGWA